MDEIQTWRDKITTASDDELRALHEAGYLGLAAINEDWRFFIQIIQDEVHRRGIAAD